MGSKFWNTKYQDSFGSFKINGKESLALNAGLGYNFFSGLRTELTYTHIFPVKFVRPNGEDKGFDAKGNALMLRAVYDIYDFESFKLFIGAGLGASRVKANARGDLVIPAGGGATKIVHKPSSKDKYNFAHSAMVGISFDLGPQNVLELGYLYADYGRTSGLKEAPEHGKFAMRSHNILLGIRYEF